MKLYLHKLTFGCKMINRLTSTATALDYLFTFHVLYPLSVWLAGYFWENKLWKSWKLSKWDMLTQNDTRASCHTAESLLRHLFPHSCANFVIWKKWWGGTYVLLFCCRILYVCTFVYLFIYLGQQINPCYRNEMGN